ncbi:MAG TPA: DUF1622 domain-containing protein [Pyrinomonadaceae bacterium]|nr:DUF1622 domain-containing protein [Pyrinomonadaceae bacterium]
MEELFKTYAGHVALFVEAIAAIVITIGAVQAAVRLLIPSRRGIGTPHHRKKKVWLGFGVWLLLGLEFELAADIVRSAISPTWTEIGQLGAIAVIRTFLNYFLEKDVEKYVDEPAERLSES